MTNEDATVKMGEPGRLTLKWPGIAENRQDFASPSYLAFPQSLHNPQIRRSGFPVSKHTHACAPPFGLGGARAASHSELTKRIRTVPTYRAYDKIARVLRAAPESGLFLMARGRSWWVRSAGSNAINTTHHGFPPRYPIRLLFASIHCYLDPSNSAPCTRASCWPRGE